MTDQIHDLRQAEERVGQHPFDMETDGHIHPIGRAVIENLSLEDGARAAEVKKVRMQDNLGKLLGFGPQCGRTPAIPPMIST